MTGVNAPTLIAPVAGALEISPKPVPVLERPEGGVFSVAFSADGALIATGAGKQVRLYEVTK